MAKKTPSLELTLSQFRKAANRLRDAGLIAPLTPSAVKRGHQYEKTPALLRAVKRYADILKGTATTVRSESLAITNKQTRTRGLKQVRVVGAGSRGKVTIVPKFKDEIVRVRNKSLEFISPEGRRVQRLELPDIRHDTLEHFFEDLKRKANIDDLRKEFPHYMVGARFFNNRTVLYSLSKLKTLLNTLQTYDTVVTAHGRKQTAEVIRNIELILVPSAVPPARTQEQIDWGRTKGGRRK